MIVAAILEQARRNPRKTALVFNDEALSYGWLAGSIEAVAAAAQAQDIARSGVALVAVRSLPAALVTSLALRRHGLTTMMAPLTGMPLAAVLPGTVCAVQAQGETWSGLDALCARAAIPLHSVAVGRQGKETPGRPHGGEGGHILQTSGTTGEPKYVFYDPASEVPFIQEWFDIVGLDESSVYGAFDFPLWTAVGYRAPMATWLAGGTIVLQQDRPSHALLRNRSLTRATAIPAMLQGVLALPEDAFAPNPSLRLAIVGASPSSRLVAQVRARITPHVENRIGSTETRTLATTVLLDPDDLVWHRPAPGARVEVVDDQDAPVPVGSVGHLRVGTAGGPVGYVGDPEASARFFRAGFFYTGDRAVFRADGRFALQGRSTDVLNVSGFKVAPAPIEERLCDAFGLRGVCLLAIPPAEGGDEGLSVVIEADEPVDTAVLGTFLEREIVGFARAQVFYIARLPRNATGKLMRDEVRELVAARG